MRSGVARAARRGGCLLALAGLLAACGGDGGATADTEAAAAADAAALNRVLARQLAVVAAYDDSLDRLAGERLALAGRLRAQEQEHVNAVVEAMRAIGAESDPAEEAVAGPRRGGEAGRLAWLAELEARTIQIELDAIAELSAPGARRALAAIVANQAQHLVLLRQELGAGPARSVPGAFETGAEPLP